MSSDTERAAPRETSIIFSDLKALCSEKGFIHTLSELIFRDTVVYEDQQSSLNDSYERRRNRLNNNEILLLARLWGNLQTPEIETENIADQMKRADSLMEELHQSYEKPMKEEMLASIAKTETTHSFAEAAREYIFYGADAAYGQQYRDLARHRYKNDGDWLLRNVGISIRSIIEIADYIHGFNTFSTKLLVKHRGEPKEDHPKAFEHYMFPKEQLRKKFGSKANAFIELFSTSSFKYSFESPLDYNELSSKPLLDVGEFLYIVSTYKLYESIYESPYYWIQLDKDYQQKGAANRGNFLEHTIELTLGNVFGPGNVFRGGKIFRKKGQAAAEADTLVIYGEFALVFQAKSKRLTLNARRGDDSSLNNDFQAAVQDAYNQAISFANLMIGGEAIHFPDGTTKTILVSRVFPVVVLSDSFPALLTLTSHLLKAEQNQPPIVVDVFFLDILSKTLPIPAEFLYYIQQRCRYFDRISTSSEYNILGYHIAAKLHFPDDVNLVTMENDLAHNVEKLVLQKFKKKSHGSAELLEKRIQVPEILPLLESLRNGVPEAVGLYIELIDFSTEGLREIASQLEKLRSEVRTTGKNLKGLSLLTSSGGVTFIIAQRDDENTRRAGAILAERHKYVRQRDRWYVVIDALNTSNPIDAFLPLWSKWEPSEELETLTKEADTNFVTTELSLK